MTLFLRHFFVNEARVCSAPLKCDISLTGRYFIKINRRFFMPTMTSRNNSYLGYDDDDSKRHLYLRNNTETMRRYRDSNIRKWPNVPRSRIADLSDRKTNRWCRRSCYQGYDEILIASEGVSCTEIITSTRTRWNRPGITRCADDASDKRNNRRKSGTGLRWSLAFAVSNRTR